MLNVIASSYLSKAAREFLSLSVYCLIFLSFYWGSLSLALAQDQASHQLTIMLPRLLSLRISDTTFDPEFLLVATNNAPLVSTQGLGIRTNGQWSLSASFSPCTASDNLSLRAAHGNEVPLRSYSRVIMTGSATTGWLLLPIESQLGLFSTPSPCQGQLLYTLTQP